MFEITEYDVLLESAGVFKVAAVYTFEDDTLFAKHGSGFIRLKANNQTSKSKVGWRKITCVYETTSIGWMKLNHMGST